MTDHDRYAPPKASVEDLAPTGVAAPPLWNPNAAASWSLLFSPIFGAYLHMKNWEALGNAEKAAASRTWVILTVVYMVVMLLLTFMLPESKGIGALGRVGGFAVLIGWYYQIGKSQQSLVLARYGKTYPRRGWTWPLLVALGALVAYFALAFVVVLVLAMVRGE